LADLDTVRHGAQVSFENPKPGNDPMDWLACVLGCLSALRSAKGSGMAGADIWLNVPPARQGGASWAALAVATLRALGQACNMAFEGTELPALTQKVGTQSAPAGMANVLASHFGERGLVLPILCQPDHVGDPFPMPAGLHFAGIGLGAAHLADDNASVHGNVRTAAFMGYTMLAMHEGAYAHELQLARDTGQRENLLYNGYLANITPREFEDRYAWLPRQLKGSEFLDKYACTIDTLAEVNPDVTYNILQATRHPVYEHTRTQYFALLLQHFPPQADDEMRGKSLRQLGSWMRQSHESHAACGLGNPQADELVQMAHENAHNGVHGARMTGCGDAVCLLCEGEKGLETARKIHEAHQRKTGSRLDFII